MQRVEERLEILPPKEEEKKDEVVKVQVVFQLIQQLESPALRVEERLEIASQLWQTLGMEERNSFGGNFHPRDFFERDLFAQ